MSIVSASKPLRSACRRTRMAAWMRCAAVLAGLVFGASAKAGEFRIAGDNRRRRRP